MALKKSELYSSLWKSCSELRGRIDAAQYKEYVLVLLFVKYISDTSASRTGVIEVPEGGSFADLVALKGDREIGDKMNRIIGKLAQANNLHGVIDVADFNNSDKLGKGKEMQDRLSNMIAVFENPVLSFHRHGPEEQDILGDAYEYLIHCFANAAGKSKGQFYTPAEVSRVMAKILGIQKTGNQTIYDPTCGSGSLLLAAASEAETGVSIYGQEMDAGPAALAKMNMILHDHPNALIWHDNTLTHPYFQEGNGTLKTFDFVVANPPFSSQAWSAGFDPTHDLYERFVEGIPPAKNGDYAFLLHVIHSLKRNGKGAIILPHGVLFRGNTEGAIRKTIIRKGYIKGIIGLPANLFYGTGIPACIVVLDKENAEARTDILMIDGSRSFMKDGNQNRLRHQDIRKIVDVFNQQIELPGYSRRVCLAEIADNDYNLNIPRYIDSAEPEDLQDVEAHLLGGIPDRDIDALEPYWQVFPTLKQQLFAAEVRPGYSQLTVAIAEIKPTIFTHPEFVAYTQCVSALFEQWQTNNMPLLKNLDVGSKPKQLIEELSEDLLQLFARGRLIDKYDVYQHLMSCWSDTMQDDVYMIAQDGWRTNEDLIPKPLLINRYFAAEQQYIGQLEAAREAIVSQMAELDEEHGGEGELLEEAKNEKGKITRASVKARLMDILADSDTEDERKMLNTYLSLLDQEMEAKRRVEDAKKALNSSVSAQYRVLSEDEVKTLVVDEKWLARLEDKIKNELTRISQNLAGRIKELAERYEIPLPRLLEEVEISRCKVDEHLRKLGFVW
jgi:type I restriction enzyme M protein